MKRLAVKKGQILQAKGDLNTKVYSVESGLLRSYSIDDKGKEHIFLFAPENWIVADNCDAETPCELYIDVLEDAVLVMTKKDKMVQIANTNSLVKRLATLQSRIIKLMSSTAIERYDDFIETYPDITQRVPQRMIASYLGITPEALSKAKGDKARAK